MEFFFKYILLTLEIYKFLFIVYIISSWFWGLPKNKIGYFVTDVINPFLQLMKKLPHRFGLFDLSAIYAILALNFIHSFLVSIFNNINL